MWSLSFQANEVFRRTNHSRKQIFFLRIRYHSTLPRNPLFGVQIEQNVISNFVLISVQPIFFRWAFFFFFRNPHLANSGIVLLAAAYGSYCVAVDTAIIFYACIQTQTKRAHCELCFLLWLFRASSTLYLWFYILFLFQTLDKQAMCY